MNIKFLKTLEIKSCAKRSLNVPNFCFFQKNQVKMVKNAKTTNLVNLNFLKNNKSLDHLLKLFLKILKSEKKGDHEAVFSGKLFFLKIFIFYL